MRAVASAMWGALLACVREACARHLRRRRAKAAFDALRGLDDHTLHDLGFDSSEIGSVVAEWVGEVPPDRIRIVQSLHDYPK
jgi:uncharacterized protein YjiS (DUF1127 family)